VGGRQQRRHVFGGSPTRGYLAKGAGIVCAGYGQRAAHLRRRWRASGRGDRQVGHERKLTSCYRTVKMHGETPTSHSRRRVAAGQSRWLFCRCHRRGIRVFRLHDTGCRGASARFSRRLYPRGVGMDRLDGHPELKRWDILGAQRFSKHPNFP